MSLLRKLKGKPLQDPKPTQPVPAIPPERAVTRENEWPKAPKTEREVLDLLRDANVLEKTNYSEELSRFRMSVRQNEVRFPCKDLLGRPVKRPILYEDNGEDNERKLVRLIPRTPKEILTTGILLPYSPKVEPGEHACRWFNVGKRMITWESEPKWSDLDSIINIQLREYPSIFQEVRNIFIFSGGLGCMHEEQQYCLNRMATVIFETIFELRKRRQEKENLNIKGLHFRGDAQENRDAECKKKVLGYEEPYEKPLLRLTIIGSNICETCDIEVQHMAKEKLRPRDLTNEGDFVRDFDKNSFIIVLDDADTPALYITSELVRLHENKCLPAAILCSSRKDIHSVHHNLKPMRKCSEIIVPDFYPPQIEDKRHQVAGGKPSTRDMPLTLYIRKEPNKVLGTSKSGHPLLRNETSEVSIEELGQ